MTFWQAGQQTLSRQYSATSRGGRGRSKTCRRSCSVTGRRERSSPQEQRVTGRVTTVSGVSTASRVSPLCPGCPPGFFPDGVRRLLGAGFRTPSLEGGLKLFWEFFLICRSSSLMRDLFRREEPPSLEAVQSAGRLFASSRRGEIEADGSRREGTGSWISRGSRDGRPRESSEKGRTPPSEGSRALLLSRGHHGSGSSIDGGEESCVPLS